MGDSNQVPKLIGKLGGKLGCGECYNAVQTFQKNKSPGNEGLTLEFYIDFKPQIGILLVDTQNPTSATTVTIPYIKGTPETIARILQPYNIRVANKPTTMYVTTFTDQH